MKGSLAETFGEKMGGDLGEMEAARSVRSVGSEQRETWLQRKSRGGSGRQVQTQLTRRKFRGRLGASLPRLACSPKIPCGVLPPQPSPATRQSLLLRAFSFCPPWEASSLSLPISNILLQTLASICPQRVNLGLPPCKPGEKGVEARNLAVNVGSWVF